MESILCIDTPVQMISCTDTNGKITPMRFRFQDRTGINFSCAARICGTQKTFRLRYSYLAHDWRLSRLYH